MADNGIFSNRISILFCVNDNQFASMEISEWFSSSVIISVKMIYSYI